MQARITLLALAGVVATGIVAGGGADVERRAPLDEGRAAEAHEGHRLQAYDVTITNLTRDQQFTPILVATHRAGDVSLFELGSPASAELEAVAEFGDTAPLNALLMATPGIGDIQTSGGLLDPGASVTVRVHGSKRHGHFSLASMLIPTNDAFFALNDVAGPGRRGSVAYRVVAYDAGTEVNDEACASIPGPDFAECGGPGSGGSPEGGEEGFVHVHAGIHGIGDLDAAQRDWRNPVAAVRIAAVANDRGDGDDDDDDDD